MQSADTAVEIHGSAAVDIGGSWLQGERNAIVAHGSAAITVARTHFKGQVTRKGVVAWNDGGGNTP
ncbi:hypothetical protein D3C83_333450 [compost metagenome]